MPPENKNSKYFTKINAYLFVVAIGYIVFIGLVIPKTSSGLH